MEDPGHPNQFPYTDYWQDLVLSWLEACTEYCKVTMVRVMAISKCQSNKLILSGEPKVPSPYAPLCPPLPPPPVACAAGALPGLVSSPEVTSFSVSSEVSLRSLPMVAFPESPVLIPHMPVDAHQVNPSSNLTLWHHQGPCRCCFKGYADTTSHVTNRVKSREANDS